MKRMFFACLALAGLLLPNWAQAAECELLQIQAGATTAVASGEAPPDDVLCIELKTEPGHSYTLELAEGRNVIFSIEGVVEAQDRHRFVADAPSYKVEVGQLMRAATAEPFRLQVSRTGAGNGGDGWTVSPDRAIGRLQAETTAKDGTTTIYAGCSRIGFVGFGLSVVYQGERLQRVDDEREPVRFDFSFADGSIRSHEAEMHYFAPDKTHLVSGKLPKAFLDDFARGETMLLRNGRGEEVLSVSLDGSSRMRALMAEICQI